MEQDDFGFGREGENLIDYLLWRLPMNGLTCRWIVWLAHGRKKHAQIIKNLGRGRDRGTGIRSRAPLLDRDRGGKPVNRIYVRLFHLIQKLPGVGGEAFHVAALPLSIKRIEGE